MSDTKLLTLIDLIDTFSRRDNNDETSAQTENNIRIFDMGRRIKPIALEQFEQFEQTLIAWPYPLVRSAWFAISFTYIDDNGHNNVNIWFLKFPLDEQGKLILAARDEYIEQFVRLIEQKLNNSDILEKMGQESPYGFKPSEEKLANINAKLKVELKLEPSEYFNAVLEFLQAGANSDSWQELGYQGIADYCAFLQDKRYAELEAILTKTIDSLPNPVLHAFSTCLEHYELSNELQAAIFARANVMQEEEVVACLHALAEEKNDGKNAETIQQLIKQALQSDFAHKIEVLTVISGRNWNHLKKQPELMKLYLEALAKNTDGQSTFTILLSDLLFIPGMRESVLNAMRDPQRSEQLSQAIGHFYQENEYPANS